jgi:5-methyltetrahydropteroyltriglutamate--homocysteine methyltransferase
MTRSTERFLTTFVGSLARPADLIETLKAKESGQSYNHETFNTQVRGAVAEAVRRQVEAGVDVVSDGEQGKAGFVNYIGERLAGFEPCPSPLRAGPWVGSREVMDFPEYYEWYSRWRGASVGPSTSFACTGPIAYKGQQALQRDIDNFKAALKAVNVEGAFMPATSPANVEAQRKNEYYPTEEAYLYARHRFGKGALSYLLRHQYRPPSP